MKRSAIFNCLYFSFLLFSLLCVTSQAKADTVVETYSGQPFGVGKITVDVPAGLAIGKSGDDRVTLSEKNGRIVYQVRPERRFLAAARAALGDTASSRVTIFFLFKGKEPLQITAFAPAAVSVQTVPQNHPRRHRRLRNAWWREYKNAYSSLSRNGDFPLVVQNYLTTTLARRMHLPLPRSGGLFRSSGINQELGLLLGTESIRAAIQKDVLLQSSGPNSTAEAANQPLPKAFSPPAIAYPPVPSTVPVEAIAMHVPHECLYIRFGSFTNYLWMRSFSEQWGGDMANMIAVRGIDYGLNKKVEQQFGLKQTALAKVLGPKVISDVAIVGSDTFLREGAAIGIMFEARSNLLLGNNLQNQRKTAMKRFSDATEETLTIDGHSVSYISTPGGEMRSYYAVDGDYHFVTTSKTLVRRFYEAGRGVNPLGASKEFRYSRIVRPIERNDTIFAYLSDAFIRQMVSPQYRVEMTRRMRSLTEIDTIRVARLAARAEGSAANTIDELIAGDFLPLGFGHRVDESELFETETGFVDSLRGKPGTFVPIPDMPVTAVTTREAAAYREFEQIYRGEWKRMDPVIITVQKRTLGPAGLERLTIELLVTPYHKPTYERIAGFLGPPTTLAKAPVPGDIASLEVVMGGRLLGLLGGKEAKPTHIVGALRDYQTPFAIKNRNVVGDGQPASLMRGYIAVWPRPGIFETHCPPPADKPLDDNGYGAVERNMFLREDTWQRRFDDWGVLSFKKEVLETVTPQLQMVEMERPAQVRLRIEDLSNKQITSTINAFGYSHARKASESGSRFMNSLNHQFNLPTPECKAMAEQLVGGRFQCPLGGEYAVVEPKDGHPAWTSTAMRPGNQFLFVEVPEDYTFPMLTWFRGITGELSLTDDTLSAHIELDVQNKVQNNGSAIPGIKLPSFGFGSKKEAETPKKDAPKKTTEPEEIPVPAPAPAP